MAGEPRNLAHVIAFLETVASTAREVAAGIPTHLETAPPELVGTLYRGQRILEDLSTGLSLALGSLAPAVRAKIGHTY